MLEGEWTLCGNNNYDKFLAAVGAGPLSSNMVLRARINLTIKQELDKQWRLSYETVIRAKSIRGYTTRAGKVTENKFQVGVETPEMLDDWDQRWAGSRVELQTKIRKDFTIMEKALLLLKVPTSAFTFKTLC